MSVSSMQNLERFTSLPDYIRDHILSFLSMEDAAKTSVLSRQWRHSCSSLSNLKFQQNKFEAKKSASVQKWEPFERKSSISGSSQAQQKIFERRLEQKTQIRKKMEFRNFVDHLLIQHDQTDIRSFHLSMSIDRLVTSDDHIKTWILFAILHNVRELYLNIDFNVNTNLIVEFRKLRKFNYSFFSCSSLNLLSLSNVIVQLVTDIFLPNLNTLKLSYVDFSHQDVAQNLFSSCPLLQYLTLKHCRLIHGNTFTISVSISVSKLRQINYTGNIMPHISSETLSSLKDVTFVLQSTIYAVFIQEVPVYTDKGNVLTSLHNVETLILRGSLVKILGKDWGLFSSRSWSCCSLKHLELDICPLKDDFVLVTNLLRAYSNLEFLRITFKVFQGGWPHRLQRQEDFLTASLLTHLKGVEIQNFGRRDKFDLHIVRYLLENALSLEKIKINYEYDAWKDTELRMSTSEMILSYTMASSHAIIEFFGEE